MIFIRMSSRYFQIGWHPRGAGGGWGGRREIRHQKGNCRGLGGLKTCRKLNTAAERLIPECPQASDYWHWNPQAVWTRTTIKIPLLASVQMRGSWVCPASEVAGWGLVLSGMNLSLRHLATGRSSFMVCSRIAVPVCLQFRYAGAACQDHHLSVLSKKCTYRLLHQNQLKCSKHTDSWGPTFLWGPVTHLRNLQRPS